MANQVDLHRVSHILDYTFTNEELLEDAIRSAHRIEFENGDFQSFENNRRLATVGQAVIKLILTEVWFEGVEPLGMSIFLIPHKY